MKVKFSLNTILFLIIIIITIIASAVFELYHRDVEGDLPEDLRSYSENPISPNLDTKSLKQLYTGKNNYYEP